MSVWLICMLPLSTDLLWFTATANLSIASLNVSLMINRVGFYQVILLPARTSQILLDVLYQPVQHT